MNGIIVVDKPADMSSAQVVQAVKKILRVRKVGHTGTLDPFATGVLVCCVNRATRLARFIAHGEKHYEGVMCLGIRTDSQDFTGRVLSQRPLAGVTEDKIKRSFHKMVGESHQKPPAFSALKHQGKPLYELARKGVFLEKSPRPIQVYDATVLDVDYPWVRFRVVCSPGTYVRTLCDDIGELLGCGAHLTELRRTESGGFTLQQAVSLTALERSVNEGEPSRCLIPMGKALNGIPEVQVGHQVAAKIRHGKPLTERDVGSVVSHDAPWLKVTDLNRNLVAVLDSSQRRGILPYLCVFVTDN
jgi:tRNA pseudouridine55 synthase